MKKIFDITGMTCAACAAHVEKAAKGLEGVKSAEVSLLLNRLTVDADIPDGDIIAAVERVGYGAAVVGDKGGSKATSSAKTPDYAKTLMWRFILSIVFLIPLMYFSMGH